MLAILPNYDMIIINLQTEIIVGRLVLSLIPARLVIG